MAEQAEQNPDLAEAIADDDEDDTGNYKAPPQKSIKEIIAADEEDESLKKYKETLLGAAKDGVIIDDSKPNVIVKKLTISFEDHASSELDLTLPPEKIKETKIVFKEGCQYSIKLHFNVQREIVAGLRYHHYVTRKGIKVDRESYMVGSFGPKLEEHIYTSPPDEAPKGMLSRGEYKVHSKFCDDDKNLYLEWVWTFVIKKDWASE